MELAFFDRIDDFLFEHQVADVLGRDHDALLAGKPFVLADVEKRLDLVGHSADGLDFAFLADRTGHGDPLLDGDFGNGAEQHVELGAGGAVAFHHAVALFEAEGGGKRYGLVVGKAFLQEAAQDHQPLGVDVAAHLGFPVDGDHPFPPHGDDRRDAVGLAELVITGHEDGQPVHLPHLVAVGFDPEDVFLDQFLDPFFDQVGSVDALLDGVSTCFAAE